MLFGGSRLEKRRGSSGVALERDANLWIRSRGQPQQHRERCKRARLGKESRLEKGQKRRVVGKRLVSGAGEDEKGMALDPVELTRASEFASAPAGGNWG
jgi:hypothetical protein